MSKETMIVFVYDTECLKDEADDPVSAVLYFHPSWVSDTQKVALCGQLMGTSYFLKDCFFKPRILALQNGKFVLREFGRFILAVGTDRNISDYLLEHRANLLAALVTFFHRDLQTVYDQFVQEGTTQSKNLSEKLYHIFETYLPILQHNGNIFQNVPKLRLPKTASDIFLDAIQVLQCCQQTKGILGGAILYHNKVVASQLSDGITKKLVLTDPLHIRTTAEQLHSTDFHIPNGVQMIVIYIDAKQYRKLSADAQRAQNLQTTQLSQNLLPFQYAKRKMKRDKSLIFTNIPEEGSSGAGGDHETIENNVNEQQTGGKPFSQRPKSLLVRPNHLPLRARNMTTKELPESGIASINFDETDSYPEFIGRTSVCSTPMTENKVLHVGNIMSICANPEDDKNSNNKQPISGKLNNRRNSLKMDLEKFFQNFIANSNKPLERRNSFTDLQDSFKKISKKLSLKQFSNASKTDVNRNGNGGGVLETPDFIENDDEGGNIELSNNSNDNFSKNTHTIVDPTDPTFNANGQPISRSLFQEFLEKYYTLWDANDEMKQDAEIAQLIEEFKEFDSKLKKIDGTLHENANAGNGVSTAGPPLTNHDIDRNLNVKPKTPMDKKSLSLPIKPLTDAAPSMAGTDIVALPPFSSGSRKQPGAIPLTPLMAKLSVLALNDDRTSNAWTDATPGAGVEIQTPLHATKPFPRRSSLKCDDAVDALSTMNAPNANATDSSNGLQRVELYMCGQQNMTLLLLMEEGSALQQEIVQKMFDICVAKFPHMESQLNESLNISVNGDKREGGYSLMCIDSKWDALQRNGPWNPVELNTLECMHSDLGRSKGITDLILRSHDTVVYGYRSGRTEIFFKEPAHQISGIPPPSDPMGNIPMRAKNKLERDHSYILF